MWGLSRDILCNPSCGCHVWVTRSFCWVNTELNTTLAAALTTVPTRINRGDDEMERCTPECGSELWTQTLRWKVLQQDRRARILSTPQTDVARHSRSPNQNLIIIFQCLFSISHTSSAEVLARRLIGTCTRWSPFGPSHTIIWIGVLLLLTLCSRYLFG